mmetsp:Transcript_50497/g.99355  ORF Transcript_50497/g.99355 Transcript_50497/m.99355 type:complete len:81 (+) Transcript_50497:240-482(+)
MTFLRLSVCVCVCVCNDGWGAASSIVLSHFLLLRVIPCLTHCPLSACRFLRSSVRWAGRASRLDFIPCFHAYFKFASSLM